ncbi:RHS repeat-associated core domain-containing protein [Ulvibacter litoralis]|uniref:RHS repeat-associated core domain-containing protein n=1 Tax=Ulvibacter litoralis TaxID=227084 RepID=A0A1G7HE59_9FLAO|nr:hypothetical protein GCM10008083_22580 [Ulvibacter litoralis]SDE98757.1 RHS repeat-associated core domain-containing protein [Ulvibacter litoralis]
MNDCPFRYQGHFEDVETGLYYNRFRYYSAEEGAYISQDPIGLDSGEYNLYSYVQNSNALFDPLGLERYHRKNGQFGKKRGRPRNPSVHGNSKTSTKPAVLYAMYDGEGNFQKYGITQEVDNPRKRYGNTIPAEYEVIEIDRGKRSDMLKKERHLTERGGGPLNKEKWANTKCK